LPIFDYDSVSPIGSWTGSTYDGITGMIQAGRNGGSWNGNDIRTSSPTGTLHGVGVAEAARAFGISDQQTHLFAGQTVDATTVLVKYTYVGDADLDGAITSNDYFQIDTGFLANRTGWINGDFDYSGSINSNDYFDIDLNFLNQG